MSRCYSFWIICALSLSTHCILVVGATTIQGTEENCILSFVVPRDKMKSSCDHEEKVNRHINAMEMRMNIYKQQVIDLHTQLDKQRQLHNEKLEMLERQVQAMSANMDVTFLTERRLTLLEKGLQQMHTDMTPAKITAGKINSSPEEDKSNFLVYNAIDMNPSVLPNMVRTMIQSEVKGSFHNFTKRFETYIQEQILLYSRVFNILPKRSDESTHHRENYASSSPLQSTLKDKADLETSPKKFPPGNNSFNDGFEQVKAKVNDTGGRIAKHFGSYIKNATSNLYKNVTDNAQVVTAPMPRYENHHLVINPELQLNQELSYSGENSEVTEASLEDTFTSLDSVISGSASSRIRQKSAADVNSTAPEFVDSDSKNHWKGDINLEKVYQEIIEMEGRLKDEITDMLYSPFVEVMSLMEKQKIGLEETITFQEKRCERVNKDLIMQIKELENNIQTTNLHLQALSTGFQESLTKLEQIKPLEAIVNEIKNNITTDSRTTHAMEHEEQSKKIKKLERLMGVYQQSLEHYRNETRHEYREIRDSLEKDTNTLRIFSKTLQNNLTSTVNSDISRLNNSYMNRFREIKDHIRTQEETLLLVQIDIDNVEKMLENKPKRSDRDFDEMQEAVNQITVNQRDLKKKLDNIEEAQSSINENINLYAKDVLSLTREVKLKYDEWLPWTFEFDSSRTDCFGDQYVKRTRYSKTKLVGVVLCSPTRYKIFLSASLNSTFLNIGDANGMGEDHCEFVGGNKDIQIKLSQFKAVFGAVQGYARNHWGQEPVASYLNAIKPSPHWYECGVKIP